MEKQLVVEKSAEIQDILRGRKSGKKVAAVSCSSPVDEDAEFSRGEFTQADNRLRDDYHRKEAGKRLVTEAKKRKKKADREQKRLGGPIVLWTFKDTKKGRTIMAMKEEMEEKAAEEKAEKKEQVKKAKVAKKAKMKKAKVKKKNGKMKKGKKGKKGKMSRGPRVRDGKITLLEKTNPKREGSKAHKRYELYRKHKTIAKYLDAGGKRSSLRYDEKHKFIKTSGIKTSADKE